MVLPEVRTGPVRVSGYAIKLRRVINAALRDLYKEKKLDAKGINKLISDLNAVIYDILVERFKIPKEAVVNIILNYDIENEKFVIKDIKVEVFDLNHILTTNTTNEIKKALGLAS